MKRKLVFLVGIAILISGCTKVETNLRYTGTVEATQIDVSAELSGIIREISVSEGDQVTEGQQLAMLDDTSLELSALQRESAYQAQEAQLKDLKKGTRQEEIEMAYQQVNTAEQAFITAEETYLYRKDLYETAKELFEKEAVPEQQLKDAKLSLDQASTTMENAREAINTALTRVKLLEKGVREDQVKAQRHLAEQSKIAYEEAKLQQEKAIVVSPAKAMVLYKNFQQGEFLPLGAPIVTLVNLQDLWIKVYIPEKELHRITLGQQVKLISDIHKADDIQGEIIFISPKSEFTPSNVTTKEDRHNRVHEVRIKILQGQAQLNPGMMLDVEL